LLGPGRLDGAALATTASATDVAQCKEAGASRDELFETFQRGAGRRRQHRHPAPARAVDFLDQLEGEGIHAATPAHSHELSARGGGRGRALALDILPR